MKENSKSLVKNVVPPWLLAMREAASSAISPADIKEMVENQVKLAKAGDQNALKFVFTTVLGGMDVKGATFVQKNYYGRNGKKPTEPTS